MRVSDANADWWLHAPTMQDVTVHGGSITLPFLSLARTQTIAGDPGTQLSSYLAETRHRAGGDAPERTVARLRASAADDSVAQTAHGHANRHG